jgi:folate-binding protein YgfZ
MSSDSQPTVSGWARLAGFGVIRARGADAASFLHAQLTQDVTGLGPADARLAAWCSAKGRMLATLVAWRPSPDEVLLACSADLLAPVLRRLSMFVLRSKCRLDDASAEIALIGLVGPAVASALEAAGARPGSAGGRLAVGDGASVLALPAPVGSWLGVLALPVRDGELQWPPTLVALRDGIPEVASGMFDRGMVDAGVPWVVAATTEQFVPQMLNLELVGGVNFRKGCYPGQEVVARSQYRGTLKRRMQRFEVVGPAHAGQEVFHAADPGQPAGMVALAAADGERSWLLAEVKLAALAGGSLHLGTPDGPVLVHQPLPYALPVDGDDTPARVA